ncbi:Pseudouridine synthase II [Lasiodiplodia theobromae]|uniref:tRNA pseudouridine(55) synthase n=1 Tax=Lasiodiplodia theobromae TaxID=45133 RepID=A0A8H7IPN5_9PEZI|nr:Pseudouridine synthase II [Lasiodiplodia theobromae]
MSSASKPQLLEGVLAIHKPLGISSAQVIRDVENHFNPSELFQPNLEAERRAVVLEKRKKGDQYRKKKGPNRTQRVKMGHGGTLDPLATGILILGLGSGTKALGKYLNGCQKTYETTVLFGCATDTFDNTGKVIGRAPYAHVTRDMVEKALEKFKGNIMQTPPVYSAIKFDGKKAYEIMREGGTPPKMKERPVTVYNLELVDWFEPGTHNWRYPQEEMDATAEEKETILKASLSSEKREDSAAAGEKRKREEGDSTEEIPEKKIKAESGAEPAETTATEPNEAPTKTVAEESTTTPAENGANAAAALIRMTVSSGFYVRTLCHDLGAAVNSLACMTYLVRTQQGEFELGKNVLEYEDLQAGEPVWGPKVKTLLQDWMVRQQSENQEQEKPKARSKSPEKREKSKSPPKTATVEDEDPEMD